ncbi:TRAP transporter substrate-binding protein [Calditerricola satsumensis]|uniref:C4-dicarboxylate ABC transporter n=1 Tax=Calditerricola satsumensis TaxID=373054 RepID=A0A8J3FEV3_9BACI|nr:TRAP transporter substrate-binding protein [Calditerricola satsumensis]GGK02039.1 C4-dicarboxylate ABC transporter [Calditerricola satsumensis]
MAMWRKRWKRSGACVLLLMLTGCVATGALPADPEQEGLDERIVIRFSHVVAEHTPKGQAARRFAELVHRYTGGRVEVRVFPNAQLYSDDDEMEAVRRGDVELIAPATAKIVHEFPEWQVFDLPYAFPNEEAVARAMDGPIGQRLLAGLTRDNLVGLAIWDNGFKQMTSSVRPLRRPEDFRGLVFRTMGSPVLDEQFRLLGAHPVHVPFDRLYAALERGAVDGQENTLSNIYTRRLYEVQRYLTISNHGYLGYVVIANRDFWESLPPDIRRQVQRALDETTAWIRQYARAANVEALELLKRTGRMEIHVQTPEERQAWRAAFGDLDKWMEQQIGSDLMRELRALTAAELPNR